MYDGKEEHNRPSFYAFRDQKTGIYWMIPFSSQLEKYRRFYDRKKERFGRCDTIVFARVLGHEKAFLIQNMCPITAEYIEKVYVDRKTLVPVRLDGRVEKELVQKARKVLALQRRGIRLIFPDVLSIEQSLLDNQ